MKLIRFSLMEGKKTMMKKIGIILAVLLMAGSVFALQAPRPALSTTIVPTLMTHLPAPSPVPVVDAPVSGNAWYFWKMMKNNRENNFVATAPRGTYDFSTKKWMKK